jgi:hypothetical protein
MTWKMDHSFSLTNFAIYTPVKIVKLRRKFGDTAHAPPPLPVVLVVTAGVTLETEADPPDGGVFGAPDAGVTEADPPDGGAFVAPDAGVVVVVADVVALGIPVVDEWLSGVNK